MTDLLAAIRAAPADDAPRLAVADLLASQPDEASRLRAAFIRVSLDLARLPADDPRHGPLAAVVADLERQGRAAWLAGLPGFVRRAAFTRGFVERVEASAAAWTRHRDAVLAREPVHTVDEPTPDVIRFPGR